MSCTSVMTDAAEPACPAFLRTGAFEEKTVRKSRVLQYKKKLALFCFAWPQQGFFLSALLSVLTKTTVVLLRNSGFDIGEPNPGRPQRQNLNSRFHHHVPNRVPSRSCRALVLPCLVCRGLQGVFFENSFVQPHAPIYRPTRLWHVQ